MFLGVISLSLEIRFVSITRRTLLIELNHVEVSLFHAHKGAVNDDYSEDNDQYNKENNDNNLCIIVIVIFFSDFAFSIGNLIVGFTIFDFTLVILVLNTAFTLNSVLAFSVSLINYLLTLVLVI